MKMPISPLPPNLLPSDHQYLLSRHTEDVSLPSVPHATYPALRLLFRSLADRDFTMNVILPDVGEQHMLRVKNGVLLVYADTLSDDADVSITCPKNALFAILTNNQETVAKAVKVEGSAELLTLMMENMNQFPITGANPFNIIEP